MNVDHPLVLWMAQIALPMLLSAGLAMLLRSARVPGGRYGAAVVAGLVAGLLIGPGILGRADPAMHESLFVGAATERYVLDRLLARQRADLSAMNLVGITQVAIEEAREEQAAERAPLEAQWLSARAAFRDRMDWQATAAVALAACFGAIIAAPITQRAWERLKSRASREPSRAVLVGVIATMIAAAPATLMVLLIPSIADAVAPASGTATWPLFRSAAALGIVFGVAGMAGGRRASATLSTAASFAFAAAASLMIAWSAPLILVGAGVLSGVLIAITMPRGWARAARRSARALLAALLAPMIVCLAVMHADLYALVTDWRFWMLAIFAAAWAGDGRWLAAWLGWRAAGAVRASRLWSRAAAGIPPGTGLAMMGAATVLEHAGALSDCILLPAAIGALVIEITHGLRAWAAGALDAGLDASRDA